MKKIFTAGIILLSIPLLINANTSRGSIITSDNKIVAQNSDENKRDYPFKKSLTPVLGFASKDMKGLNGIEEYAQVALVRNLDVKLTINLELQQKIEALLDKRKKEYDADEIMVAVMDSKTGRVLAMASSNRYDPYHITQNDISSLNPKFSSCAYEPGSVMKPLTISIAMEHGLIKPDTQFDTFNGKLKIGEKHQITDDQKFDTLNVTDIVVYSSNVGTSQIAWKLTGAEFRDGLYRLGIGKSSGIDLSRDYSGRLKNLQKLKHKLHRANSAYGYGMMVTFTQLLKAYNVFNNDGTIVTPQLIDSLQDKKGNIFTLQTNKEARTVAISKKTADQVHDILVEVVKRGTGTKAQYDGLEIGGKTGTAHIAKNGKYVRKYHSSFYGFTNDNQGNKYTLGVLIIRAKAKYTYFASQSAVPVFREITGLMVREGYLLPHDLSKKPAN